ncbi:hypothetical protein [Xanthomonas campestris]|uniref:hypothetical protein n=1 Tax=Xanthomonas campestris TaxID=339 RepID=UPI0023661CEB|nr:hypothetical protein [Xanthomonas campestris]MEA9781783.1 hypothetical protein [Xanthomonas campestris pv. raphani]MEA9802187.1 hypothetical protein [Xanthomonas campestris pv. raphani]MEA9872390.1 hypothetical protein [Xanthomonas campestris pv. raphani]MEA9879701.1 hypothetical protein [Xanthomonas campestris pv. raphani]MEA9968229.1 hypothetical protein [Xanthomonas campestris pv. raphani]
MAAFAPPASALLGALQAIQDCSAYRLADDEGEPRIAIQAGHIGSIIVRNDRHGEIISRIQRAWPQLDQSEAGVVLAEIFAVFRSTMEQPERDVASRREQAARQSSNWVHSWTRRDHDGGIR